MERETLTILLVDDDIPVLDVICKLLERVGYSVIAADSGRKAIELIKDTSHRIDLVILDLIMPGMNGEMIFHKIRRLAPRIPIIITSGYNENDQIEHVMKSGCNGFLPKPYTLGELRPKIQQALEA